MPKLWNSTLKAHHEAISVAIFAAAASIISSEGFGALSMARVAQEAGIGRATLYKYFSDIDAVLAAWHERTVSQHLLLIEEIAAAHPDKPLVALRRVLLAYGEMRRHGHDSEGPSAQLHNLPHVGRAHGRFQDRLRSLLQAAARDGSVRSDVSSSELASFVFSAIQAAPAAQGARGVERIVALILKAIRT
jgi:AcrR family transcriptional regulator